VARRALDQASDDLRLWGTGAVVVPGASQNLRALTGVLSDAATATRHAADAAATVDIDSLTVQAGRLDLAAVADLEAPLARLGDALDDVVREVGRWDDDPLVPPVRDRLRNLGDDAVRARDDAVRGASAARTVPGLLGADGPRRYLVLFTSPAEARGRFGFPASYAELVADDGRLDLADQGSILQAFPARPYDQASLPADDPLVAPYVPYGITEDLRSATMTPDFPTAAGIVAEMWEQRGREPLDGVMRLDAAGLAVLLDLTGRIDVPELGRSLDGGELEEFLLFDQYVEFADETRERKELLEAIGGLVFERLVTADLPNPRRLTDLFGPVVDGDHLQVTSFDDEAQGFLDEVGLSGTFTAPANDGLMVANVNSGANKIDTFLQRSVRYRATLDGTGALTGTVEITLRNEAPAAGLPDYVIGSALDDAPPGTNRTTLLVYTAVPATAVTVDGEPAGLRSSRSGGWWVHEIALDIPSSQAVVVRLEVAGPRPDRADADYALDVRPGGGATPDHYDIAVEVAGRNVELDAAVAAQTILTTPDG
ncbi:MAG: DUF4012 domain-containing protein, partial [Acidimicrobiales bacterium]